MRALEPEVLTAVLPAALGALREGSNVVWVSGRWLTPVYRAGALRLILVLPAEPDPVSLRRWRELVRRHG